MVETIGEKPICLYLFLVILAIRGKNPLAIRGKTLSLPQKLLYEKIIYNQFIIIGLLDG